MKFSTLKITNFMPFESATFNLSGRGLVLIEGRKSGEIALSNGTGKTSLIEALLWCLFGQTLKNIYANDVVHNYGANCQVEISVDDYRPYLTFKSPTTAQPPNTHYPYQPQDSRYHPAAP